MNDLQLADLYHTLGTISADTKHIRERLDHHSSVAAMLEDRVDKLEAFKTRIATITGILGVGVPTGITVAAHKLGLL